VSCAKAVELIEMQFGLLNQVGPENHVLDRGADALTGSIGYGGMGKRVSCAKTGGRILTIYKPYVVLPRTICLSGFP